MTSSSSTNRLHRNKRRRRSGVPSVAGRTITDLEIKSGIQRPTRPVRACAKAAARVYHHLLRSHHCCPDFTINEETPTHNDAVVCVWKHFLQGWSSRRTSYTLPCTRYFLFSDELFVTISAQSYAFWSWHCKKTSQNKYNKTICLTYFEFVVIGKVWK